MLNVDLKNIEEYLNNLKKNISDYEDSLESIYYEYNNIFENVWNDNKSLIVNDNVNADKINMEKLLVNIKDLYNIYLIIYNQYKRIGNKLQCNLNMKKEIIFKYENLLLNIKQTLNKYENIGDTSFYKGNLEIYKQKEELKKIYNNVDKLKNEIEKKYKTIDQIEEKIKIDLNKITIIKINKSDIDIEII